MTTRPMFKRAGRWRICPKCGGKFSANLSTCPNCPDRPMSAHKTKRKEKKPEKRPSCRICGKEIPPNMSQCPKCARRAAELKEKMNRGEPLSPHEVKLVEEELYKMPLSELPRSVSGRLRDFVQRNTRNGEKIYTTTYAATRLLGFTDKESFINYVMSKGLKPFHAFDNELHYAAWKISDIAKMAKGSRLEREIDAARQLSEEMIPRARQELKTLNIEREKMRPEYARMLRIERKNPRAKEIQEIRSRLSPRWEELEQEITDKKQAIIDMEKEFEASFRKIQEFSKPKKSSLHVSAAEYQGKKIKLNDPVRNPPGNKKKFHVFVKDPKTKKVRKIQFGDPEMEIRRDDPERRRNFRSRHKCDSESAKDKTKAKYWSCYQWRSGKKVDN